MQGLEKKNQYAKLVVYLANWFVYWTLNCAIIHHYCGCMTCCVAITNYRFSNINYSFVSNSICFRIRLKNNIFPSASFRQLLLRWENKKKWCNFIEMSLINLWTIISYLSICFIVDELLIELSNSYIFHIRS